MRITCRPRSRPPRTGTGPPRPLIAAVTAYERDLILDALKTARGNRAKAARLLETTERIVRYKIRKHGIDPARFRG
jgi:Nif-specific regulatory protein